MNRLVWWTTAAVVAALAAVAIGIYGGQDQHAGHGGVPAGSAPAGGHNMGPIKARSASALGIAAVGGRDLAPVLVDGVREFALTVGVVRWSILPTVIAGAYAYNQQVPGPLLRVRPGERIRIRVRNELPEATTVHWHGLDIPNEQDGVPLLTQAPIERGATHVYEFVVPETPGTFFYHSHLAADRQQAVGLYGALIIEGDEPPHEAEYVLALGEWRIVRGDSYPAMPHDGMMPNYFTINGRSYPATETIKARLGDRLLFRLIGSGQFIHPIHIHGGAFEIVATDGHAVPREARLRKDTVLVGPGERYDVLWTALRPGKWLLHCHINHHMTNDGVEVDGGGGMMMVIDVAA
ncbi:MAG: hypothetical protein EXQ85_03370 [Alphaproteobacteria bacterium]|nr:hypothetical protein [Alphaproteobacteria bacterium]